MKKERYVDGEWAQVVWAGPVEMHHKVSHELFPALLGDARGAEGKSRRASADRSHPPLLET